MVVPMQMAEDTRGVVQYILANTALGRQCWSIRRPRC